MCSGVVAHNPVLIAYLYLISAIRDIVHQDGASATVSGSRPVTIATHNTQKTADLTTEDVIEPSAVPATQVLESSPPHPLPAEDQGTPAYISPGEDESLHSHAQDKPQEKNKIWKSCQIEQLQ